MYRLVEDEGAPLAGVRETLDAVRDSGLALAIASSSPSGLIEAVVDKLEIRDYFSVMCSADEDASASPTPPCTSGPPIG